MTIKVPIAKSRAQIVELELQGLDYTKKDDIKNDCVIFEIETFKEYLPSLIHRFFHAGIETGKKIFQP